MANSKPTLGFSGCFSETTGSQDVVGAETIGSAAGAVVQGMMVGGGTIDCAITTLCGAGTG